jgi:spore coat-associated protein N
VLPITLTHSIRAGVYVNNFLAYQRKRADSFSSVRYFLRLNYVKKGGLPLRSPSKVFVGWKVVETRPAIVITSAGEAESDSAKGGDYMININKKIAYSAMSIVTALALTGGATFAFFSDSGTSSANTFATGTLDLKLSDAAVNGGSVESDQETVSSSFGSSTMAPGACTGVQKLNLKNTGSIAANHAEVHLTSNVVTDNGAAATPDIDAYMRINSLNYDAGGSLLGLITDTNVNGFKDLDDWENVANAAVLDNLSLTDLNTNHPLAMDVCLDSSAINDVQGDSVVTTFTVELNQDATQ